MDQEKKEPLPLTAEEEMARGEFNRVADIIARRVIADSGIFGILTERLMLAGREILSRYNISADRAGVIDRVTFINFAVKSIWDADTVAALMKSVEQAKETERADGAVPRETSDRGLH